MLLNEQSTLFLKENGQMKADIGGGTSADVSMDGSNAAVTYVVEGQPIVSKPISECKDEFITLIRKNYPEGKVPIYYDGTVNTSGNIPKVFISRIVVKEMLKA